MPSSSFSVRDLLGLPTDHDDRGQSVSPPAASPLPRPKTPGDGHMSAVSSPHPVPSDNNVSLNNSTDIRGEATVMINCSGDSRTKSHSTCSSFDADVSSSFSDLEDRRHNNKENSIGGVENRDLSTRTIRGDARSSSGTDTSAELNHKQHLQLITNNAIHQIQASGTSSSSSESSKTFRYDDQLSITVSSSAGNQILSTPMTHGRGQRRQRTQYSASDLQILEEAFQRDNYPGIAIREKLARTLQVSEARVQVWFQNRRSRRRKIHDGSSSSASTGPHSSGTQTASASTSSSSNDTPASVSENTLPSGSSNSIANNRRGRKRRLTSAVQEASNPNKMLRGDAIGASLESGRSSNGLGPSAFCELLQPPAKRVDEEVSTVNMFPAGDQREFQRSSFSRPWEGSSTWSVSQSRSAQQQYAMYPASPPLTCAPPFGVHPSNFGYCMGLSGPYGPQASHLAGLNYPQAAWAHRRLHQQSPYHHFYAAGAPSSSDAETCIPLTTESPLLQSACCASGAKQRRDCGIPQCACSSGHYSPVGNGYRNSHLFWHQGNHLPLHSTPRLTSTPIPDHRLLSQHDPSSEARQRLTSVLDATPIQYCRGGSPQLFHRAREAISFTHTSSSFASDVSSTVTSSANDSPNSGSRMHDGLTPTAESSTHPSAGLSQTNSDSPSTEMKCASDADEKVEEEIDLVNI